MLLPTSDPGVGFLQSDQDVLQREPVHSSPPQAGTVTTSPHNWVEGFPFYHRRTVTLEHTSAGSEATGSLKHTTHFQGQRQDGQNKKKARPEKWSSWETQEGI